MTDPAPKLVWQCACLPSKRRIYRMTITAEDGVDRPAEWRMCARCLELIVDTVVLVATPATLDNPPHRS